MIKNSWEVVMLWLYPSVIIEEGLELLEEKIRKDKAFAKRTNLTKSEIMELTRLWQCAQSNLISNVRLDFLRRVRELIWEDHSVGCLRI